MKLLYTAKVDSKKSECLICGKHGIAGVIVTFKTWNEELFYCSPCISRLSEANSDKPTERIVTVKLGAWVSPKPAKGKR